VKLDKVGSLLQNFATTVLFARFFREQALSLTNEAVVSDTRSERSPVEDQLAVLGLFNLFFYIAQQGKLRGDAVASGYGGGRGE